MLEMYQSDQKIKIKNFQQQQKIYKVLRPVWLWSSSAPSQPEEHQINLRWDIDGC